MKNPQCPESREKWSPTWKWRQHFSKLKRPLSQNGLNSSWTTFPRICCSQPLFFVEGGRGTSAASRSLPARKNKKCFHNCASSAFLTILAWKSLVKLSFFSFFQDFPMKKLAKTVLFQLLIVFGPMVAGSSLRRPEPITIVPRNNKKVKKHSVYKLFRSKRC